MDDAEKYLDLKKKVERLTVEKAEARGMLNQVLKQMKEEFEVDSISTAEIEIKKLDREGNNVLLEIAKLEKGFLDEWRDKLEGSKGTN